jgi:cell division protein FtsB
MAGTDKLVPASETPGLPSPARGNHRVTSLSPLQEAGQKHDNRPKAYPAQRQHEPLEHGHMRSKSIEPSHLVEQPTCADTAADLTSSTTAPLRTAQSSNHQFGKYPESPLPTSKPSNTTADSRDGGIAHSHVRKVEDSAEADLDIDFPSAGVMDNEHDTMAGGIPPGELPDWVMARLDENCELTGALNQLSSENALLIEGTSSLTNQVSSLKKQLSASQAHRTELQNQVNKLKTENQALREKNDDLEAVTDGVLPFVRDHHAVAIRTLLDAVLYNLKWDGRSGREDFVRLRQRAVEDLFNLKFSAGEIGQIMR